MATIISWRRVEFLLRDLQSLNFPVLGRTADARDHLDCRARLDRQSDHELRAVARLLHHGATNGGLSEASCLAALVHLRRGVEYDRLEDPHCEAADAAMADNQTDLRAQNALTESWRQQVLPEGA